MEVSSLTCTPRLPPSNKKAAHSVVRPLADFPPTAWGDFFIHSVAPVDKKERAWMQERVEKLRGEVKLMLENARGHLEEEMELVDKLQRLGLAYHFEEEIHEALLGRIHDAQVGSEQDLHVVSLRFRLLRQEGYNIPSSDFNRFKDADGHFQRSLATDIRGLLSLYEAAYAGTRADVALEGASTFCRRHLEPMLPHLEPPLAAEVARTLETPLVRRMKRLEARRYIAFCEAKQGGHNDSILELAKIDFNLLQSFHKEEMTNLSRWWKELGIREKLNFARDRLVEGYFWIIGVYYEPPFKRARMMMTKIFILLSVLDDIYDSYGTLEELNMFTSVIQRWDINAEELPEYMRSFFVALSNTFREFEEELMDEQKSYRVDYLKEHLKKVAFAYLEEANWRREGYVPSLEEHLRVSLVSSTYQILTCASFLGMGDIATKETFDWLINCPKIVDASTIIARLMDDIMSHEFEQKREHVASTVECYMEQYGVSKEKAYENLYKMIEDAWKDMNQECLAPTTRPLLLLMSTFNLTRMVEIFYKHSDGYTYSSERTKDLVSLLLVESI